MVTDKINFRLVIIKELAFGYSEPRDKIPLNQIQQLELGLNVNYRWNLEKNIFGVQLDIAFIHSKTEKQANELLKFSNYTEFEVENLAKILKVTNPQDFEMDENLETTFVSIAISSARGMLAGRTNGTFFGQFIFPLVNPRELILTRKIKEEKLARIEKEKEEEQKANKKVRKATAKK